MSANLLDLWKIGGKRKAESSTDQNPSSEKAKKNERRIRKFQPAWKKEFPWVEYNEEKIEMFCVVCRKYPTVADKGSRLYTGINGSSNTGFRRDSLSSHDKSQSHYFCFQRAKNEERPEQAPLEQISRKMDKESKGNRIQMIQMIIYQCPVLRILLL